MASVKLLVRTKCKENNEMQFVHRNVIYNPGFMHHLYTIFFKFFSRLNCQPPAGFDIPGAGSFHKCEENYFVFLPIAVLI